jgi:hypothetical protein
LPPWLGGTTPAFITILLSAFSCDLFLFGPGHLLNFGSGVEAVALAIFTMGWTTVALLTASAARRVSQERGDRMAAERVAAQAHRLAQSTAALGQVRTSAEAITAALHESLHWLKAGAGVFYLLTDDRRRVVISQVASYRLQEGDSWDLDDFGDDSPFAESMRRLTPVVTASLQSRGDEYEEWSNAGPWRNRKAGLVLPITIERRVVAFLQVDFDEPREFTVDDHEYIHSICSRTGQALNRVWWHESVERARYDAETMKERADEELVERQKTELALRSSETRYRALATRTTRLHGLTASPVGIGQRDGGGQRHCRSGAHRRRGGRGRSQAARRIRQPAARARLVHDRRARDRASGLRRFSRRLAREVLAVGGARRRTTALPRLRRCRSW